MQDLATGHEAENTYKVLAAQASAVGIDRVDAGGNEEVFILAIDLGFIVEVLEPFGYGIGSAADQTSVDQQNTFLKFSDQVVDPIIPRPHNAAPS
jgi:hypothetical protein